MASIVFHNFPVFHSSFPWFSTIFLEYYLSLPLLPGTEARHPRRGRGGRDGRHGGRRRLRSLHPQVAAHAGGAAATGQVRASGIAMAVFFGPGGAGEHDESLKCSMYSLNFPYISGWFMYSYRWIFQHHGAYGIGKAVARIGGKLIEYDVYWSKKMDHFISTMIYHIIQFFVIDIMIDLLAFSNQPWFAGKSSAIKMIFPARNLHLYRGFEHCQWLRQVTIPKKYQIFNGLHWILLTFSCGPFLRCRACLGFPAGVFSQMYESSAVLHDGIFVSWDVFGCSATCVITVGIFTLSWSWLQLITGKL
jgi:hypothetical protein